MDSLVLKLPVLHSYVITFTLTCQCAIAYDPIESSLSFRTNDTYWIGLRLVNGENMWSDSTEQLGDYNNWIYPPNSDQPCISIQSDRWQPSSCHVPKQFVCEVFSTGDNLSEGIAMYNIYHYRTTTRMY